MINSLRDELKMCYDEEIKGGTKYMELSKQCTNPKISGILKDIAHDEMTHSSALSYILHMEEGK